MAALMAAPGMEDDEDGAMFGFGDSLVKLEMPDLGPDFDWGFDQMEKPSACANMPDGIFQSLCSRMMENIHRNHSLSDEEKEATLRKVVLPIPGEPAGRTLNLLEDHTGVYSAGSTGSVLWPAALGLIGLLDREIGSGSAKSPSSAVELGAGMGAVGMFLAVHKGLRVVLTEAPGSLPLLARNVEDCTAAAAAQGPRVVRAEALPLTWGDTGQAAMAGTFDLVVGSDITYRPECLQDLLTSAASLLAPGGRAFLSLQDRPGERAKLEAACAEPLSPLELLRCDATDIKESAASFEREGDDSDSAVKVWLCELAPKAGWSPPPSASASASASMARPAPVDAGPSTISSADDVEAEFERLTGIKPEKMVPKDFGRSSRAPAISSEAAPGKKANGIAAKSASKEAMTKDLLDRGLGDYLCELDEELRARIEKEAPEVRPRTAKQKQAFAKAFYEGVPPPREAFSSAAASETLKVDLTEEREVERAFAQAAAVAAGASGLLRPSATATSSSSSSTAAIADAAEGAAGAAGAEGAGAGAGAAARQGGGAGAEGGGAEGGARARMCLTGLEWTVGVDEDDGRLTATVTFGESVWVGLQGALKCSGAEGSKIFREAVDFQLSDSELRVLHAGTAVLELELPRPVDTAAAAAKICSKRRRVTVRAPLLPAGAGARSS